jgi:cytoplasmic iron level regulating protein YaaA (DUF328/UPF0246 family)
MIAILSPAKRMESDPGREVPYKTEPRFLEEAAELMEKLREYDVEGIKELMNVSDKIVELNHQRFAEWRADAYEEASVPAVFAFQGDVYQGLAAEELPEDRILKAQECIRVLSGLYGILKPLDGILPYRLEMSTKLPNKRGKDLYAYWQDRLTEAMKEELGEDEDGVLIDLASNEYSKAIDKKRLGSRVITPQFKEKKEGGYKTVAMKAKRARGLMARFMVEEGLRGPEDLKGFDREGYVFNEGMSEGDLWVFTREG